MSIEELHDPAPNLSLDLSQRQEQRLTLQQRQTLQLLQSTKAELEAVVKGLSQGGGMGPWVHPIRVAVSGRGEGIGLFEMLQLLGREATVARLRRAAETLCA